MQVRLEVSHKSGKKKTVNIHSDAVIGRSTECSLRIASSEISRKHCKLTVIESGVLVRDLESANGTWVDGKMIPPNRDVALPPGSRLSIGPVQFIVHYESSNPAIEPPGSTIEMPTAKAMSNSDRVPAPVEEAAETLPVDDSQSADDGADAIATVVVDPATVQQALADSFAAEAPDTEPAATVESTETVDTADAVEAEADAEAAAEPVAKGKLGSMFGGLLKFGRKSKKKPADVEPPTADVDAETAPTAEVPAEANAVEASETSPTDKEQLGIDAEADTDAASAADDDEGDYADDDELHEEDEDEDEVDPELGDFFNQFEE
jgi:pSer/pThr/pTyr-binding forkhead associated (FHA) protein